MVENKKVGKIDRFIWIGILVVAGILCFLYYWNREDGEVIQVRVNGAVQAEYALNEEGTYEIKGTDGGKNLLEIKDGKARIREADCPDKLCVKQGKIHKVGDSLICLPHKVVVEVIRKEKKVPEDLDAVAK